MGSYCYNCMVPIGAEAAVCPHCGRSPLVDVPLHQLKPGTLLRDRYLVGKALGQGGFGITYIGRDTLLNIPVAIKEFYPNGYAYRDHEVANTITITASGHSFFHDGKTKFLREAQTLARFSNEPGIVSVHDFFEENNTAYIVMEYIDGITLKKYISINGKISGSVLLQMMRPMIRTLEKVHAQGIIHRDISPDNIMVPQDVALKLLDFGAAREVGGDKSLSVMLKPGYAPEEQYRSKGKQGPWTDVYALCATMYFCLTGERPDESVERLVDDSLKRPSELGADITATQESVLLRGMAVHAGERYQTMRELNEALYKEDDELKGLSISANSKTKSEKESSQTQVRIEHAVSEESSTGKTVIDDNVETVFDDSKGQSHTKRKRNTIPTIVISLFLVAMLSFFGIRQINAIKNNTN